MITVDLNSPGYIIGSLGSEPQNSIFSDIVSAPLAATHHESDSEVIEAIKLDSLSNYIESLKEDADSYIGWTYVADYKTHPLSKEKGKTYYIHIRINKENSLEFGVFDEVISNNIFKTEKILKRDKLGPSLDYKLKIASKEEAEDFLLSEDRSEIKISALPKYAGYLNDYSEIYLNEHILSVFGNVWTYWYAVSDNTLYFCGFPLLLDTAEKGLIYNTDGEIVEADLPPTDLNYSNIEDSEIRLPLDLIYMKQIETTEDEQFSGAKWILNSYGNTDEATIISDNIIAKFDNGIVKNYIKGDITTTFDSYSVIGGAYSKNNRIEIADILDITLSTPDEEYVAGNSGFFVINTSYIIKTPSDTLVYYENAKRSNGFFVDIINNNIQINIGASLHYLNSGKIINPRNTINYDIMSGGEGGGGGGGGTWPSGGKEENGTTVKKGNLPDVIYCGNIGDEYYSGTINFPYLKSIPQYEVDGVTYEDEDVAGKFEYTIDTNKLAKVLLDTGKHFIDDNNYDVLSKKLSRKFSLSAECMPSDFGIYRLVSDAQVNFDNVFKLPENIENEYFYVGRDGAITSIGGAVGLVAMAMIVENNQGAISVKAKSCPRDYDFESNWGSGDIENDNFKFKNNVLSAYTKVDRRIRLKPNVLTMVKPTNTMENKDIKVTNNAFYHASKTVKGATRIYSFHPDRQKCQGFNPKKLTIRYKLNKVKLMPRPKLINVILEQYLTAGTINSNNLDINQIDIRCGDINVVGEDNGVISSSVVYQYSSERIDNQWSGGTLQYTPTPVAEVSPFRLDFSDCKLSIITPDEKYLEVEKEQDDSAETCTYKIPQVKQVAWSGWPQMKMNVGTFYAFTGDNPVEVPIIFSQQGNGWWEAHTQRTADGNWDSESYKTDAYSHYFKVGINEKYNPQNEKIIVKFFSEYSNLSHYDDSIYSKE